MTRTKKNIKSAQGAVRFDDQYRFKVDVDYVAARQRAIELAMVIMSTHTMRTQTNAHVHTQMHIHIQNNLHTAHVWHQGE